MPNDLPPGPALDALIAERIMQWVHTEIKYDDIEGGSYVPGWQRSNRPSDHVERIRWRPSTDWQDLKVLIQRLNEHGWTVGLLPDGGAHLWTLGSGGPGIETHGQSYAHAVCLAALQWVDHLAMCEANDLGTPIGHVLDRLRLRFPTATLVLTPPARSGRIYWLDAQYNSVHLELEWTADRGFRLYVESECESFATIDSVAHRMVTLLDPG